MRNKGVAFWQIGHLMRDTLYLPPAHGGFSILAKPTEIIQPRAIGLLEKLISYGLWRLAIPIKQESIRKRKERFENLQKR